MKNLPNFITLGNLFFGCMAIAYICMDAPFALAFGEEQYWSIGTANFYFGAICILLAALCDWIDGFVARGLSIESPLGGMLDSLSDIVSFGVAPSMIVMKLLWIASMNSGIVMKVPMMATAPAFAIALAGAWRLARFSQSPKNNLQFTGVPIPAIGLTIAGIGLMYYHNSLGLNNILTNKWFMYVLIALLSYSMLSPLKLFTMKPTTMAFQPNWGRYLLIIIGLLSFVFLKYAAAPVILLSYILLSMIYQPKNSAESQAQ
jgi:CDP-diacylglycerol--serine O-phosphatidyltransferase